MRRPCPPIRAGAPAPRIKPRRAGRSGTSPEPLGGIAGPTRHMSNDYKKSVPFPQTHGRSGPLRSIETKNVCQSAPACGPRFQFAQAARPCFCVGPPQTLRPRGPRSCPSYAVSNRHHLIDPIRPTREHIAISPHGGFVQQQRSCRNSASRNETFCMRQMPQRIRQLPSRGLFWSSLKHGTFRQAEQFTNRRPVPRYPISFRS